MKLIWDEQLDWLADGSIWILRGHHWEIRQEANHLFSIIRSGGHRPRKQCRHLADAKRWVKREIVNEKGS